MTAPVQAAPAVSVQNLERRFGHFLLNIPGLNRLDRPPELLDLFDVGHGFVFYLVGQRFHIVTAAERIDNLFLITRGSILPAIARLTLEQAVEKMRGPVNTPIVLRIQRKGAEKPIEIKLVRDRTAFFILSWTALHAIDESSPFYGDGMEKLKAMQGNCLALTLIFEKG